MRCVHIIVKGRVQGVGFRYTSKMCADRLGITGIVRNLYDGSVELYALGPATAMSHFLKEIADSPTRFGHVDHFSCQDLPLESGKNWKDFRVL